MRLREHCLGLLLSSPDEVSEEAFYFEARQKGLRRIDASRLLYMSQDAKECFIQNDYFERIHLLEDMEEKEKAEKNNAIVTEYDAILGFPRYTVLSRFYKLEKMGLIW